MILSLSIVIKGKTGNFKETTSTGEIHCKEEYFNRITLTNNWDKPAGKTNYGINNPFINGNMVISAILKMSIRHLRKN